MGPPFVSVKKTYRTLILRVDKGAKRRFGPPHFYPKSRPGEKKKKSFFHFPNFRDYFPEREGKSFEGFGKLKKGLFFYRPPIKKKGGNFHL